MKSEFDGMPPAYVKMLADAVARKNRDRGSYDPYNSLEFSRHGLPEGEASGGVSQEGRKRAPRDVAVMSNSVHSIGYRRKSLIRPRELVPAICSVNAMRVVMHMLFLVNASRDPAFVELTSTVSDLARAIRVRYPLGRQQAEELLTEVASTILIVRDESHFAAIPVTAVAQVDHETGVVQLKLNRELEPYLLDLRSKYRKLKPSVLGLRSSRVMLLYIFLRRYIGLNQPTHHVSTKDLLVAMQVRNDMPWAEFRKDCLQPAVDDINRKTELHVEYAAERGGRTDRKRGEVAAVVFKVSERKLSGEVDSEPGKE
jgi:hypothetical protein